MLGEGIGNHSCCSQDVNSVDVVKVEGGACWSRLVLLGCRGLTAACSDWLGLDFGTGRHPLLLGDCLVHLDHLRVEAIAGGVQTGSTRALVVVVQLLLSLLLSLLE